MFRCVSCLVVLFLVFAFCWFGKWHGKFDGAFPQQQRYLQEPRLVDILEAMDKPCAKPTRVVVTLSTFAGRLANLSMAVRSLANQSCPADAIYIFVSRNARTKISVQNQSNANISGDRIQASDVFWNDIRSLSSNVIVKEIEEDWGPATKLLAALQIEKDPSTWLITVDDDTHYHHDTILALVVAASHLPTHMAPAFWCEEAWAGWYRSWKKRTMQLGEDGTVHGWCGGFAGVLFKRFMFDEQVFNFSDAPEGCLVHDDVWWGGHLLNRGNTPYLINPGFFSVNWSPTTPTERQGTSVHILDAMAKARGLDLQAECASWFSALCGRGPISALRYDL